MKFKLIASMTLLAAMTINANAETKTDFDSLSQVEKDQIGKIAADYLVAHPEFLMQASQALQEKQQAGQQELIQKAIAKAVENQDAILNDKDTPFIGPKDAKVVMVEFFDYNCVFCSKAAPDVAQIIKDNPDVKFIFKEMPIFAQQFPSSKLAAQVGFKVFKEKGGEAYMKYHNAVYETGHFEGELTKEDVVNAAKSVGVEAKVEPSDYAEQIKKNMDLSYKVNLTGTPSFVFMPVKGATEDNSFVSVGALPREQLQNVLNRLKEVQPKETKTEVKK